jgi:osmotically-inducible protein OsmY
MRKMAKRYENRYGRGGHSRDRDRDWERERYDRDRADDRGYVERAGDEVRSWFGDDEAQRRRSMDEYRDRDFDRDRERNRGYTSDWQRNDWNPSNWQRENWMRATSQRAESHRTPRPDSDRSDWNRSEPMGFRSNHPEDWRSRESFEPPRYRESNRAWSTDDGRMEFGQSRWGRGPKGYQRADNRIHEDVCDRLTYSDVDAENIEVAVANGEVTLSGTVRDRWDKRHAEDVVEQVSGVRDVHNNIRVRREDRGIGQSSTSATDQPGTVLGVNPTASSTIKR